MIKVKIFRFRVSNASSHAFSEDVDKRWYKEKLEELDSTEWIEQVINEFCEEHNVVNIIANTIEVNKHNNARGNTVDMIYTISYKKD